MVVFVLLHRLCSPIASSCNHLFFFAIPSSFEFNLLGTVTRRSNNGKPIKNPAFSMLSYTVGIGERRVELFFYSLPLVGFVAPFLLPGRRAPSSPLPPIRNRWRETARPRRYAFKKKVLQLDLLLFLLSLPRSSAFEVKIPPFLALSCRRRLHCPRVPRFRPRSARIRGGIRSPTLNIREKWDLDRVRRGWR